MMQEQPYSSIPPPPAQGPARAATAPSHGVRRLSLSQRGAATAPSPGVRRLPLSLRGLPLHRHPPEGSAKTFIIYFGRRPIFDISKTHGQVMAFCEALLPFAGVPSPGAFMDLTWK